MLELITRRGEDGKKNRPCCYGCPIACSRYWLNEAGKRVGKRPEYEVLWAHSANLLIDDLDSVTEISEMEDDYGVDGMDTGMALAMLMEAGVIEWGDAKKCIEVIREIPRDTPLGRIVGSGAEVTAEVFGVDRVSTSKRQALSGYDPRISKGMGVTYATSTMGSDNTAGFCFFQSGDKPEGQAQISFVAQVEAAAVDTVGLCSLVGFHVSETFSQLIVEMVNLRHGTKFKTLEDLLKIGEETLKTEFEYNNRCGISVYANRLPYFFYQEAIGDKGTKFDVPDCDLDSLYVK
jgi:aldehyde:ferredoxin oxidoreductase